MATYTLTTTPQVVATAGRTWRFTNTGSQPAHLTWGGGAGAEVVAAGAARDVSPTADVSAETASGTTTLVAESGTGVDRSSASQVLRGGTA